MKNSYQYAFRDNAKGVSSVSNIYVSKSDQLEQYIFDRYVIPYLKTVKTKGLLVDIGSGEGRYSQYFGKGFKKIIAVEPDEQRYLNSVKNLSNLENAICIHGTANDVPKNELVDVVINIHVLQHIHSSAVDEILDYVAHQIKVGGLFILAITKKTDLDEPWNISWQEDSKAYYSSIPKEIFEYITAQNLPGILPVRKIEMEVITNELQNRGFKIESSVEYAPRLLESSSITEKIFIFFYKYFPPSFYFSLRKLPKYPKDADVVLVARKIN